MLSLRSLAPLAAMGAGVALAMLLISTVVARLEAWRPAAEPARAAADAAAPAIKAP